MVQLFSLTLACCPVRLLFLFSFVMLSARYSEIDLPKILLLRHSQQCLMGNPYLSTRVVLNDAHMDLACHGSFLGLLVFFRDGKRLIYMIFGRRHLFPSSRVSGVSTGGNCQAFSVNFLGLLFFQLFGFWGFAIPPFFWRRLRF
ncbi:hypothetical protein QBC38DRAFT_195975 [Podospora fimiseda]|uniref:Uncharacterized protein n=1 Tax=Podospora fimiseda TaxID=252190 RepID=A0AAN7BPW9_9PEZI|nr:hypothetical protein QBC38DRAFT_195975 [Podospora fimiseda]